MKANELGDQLVEVLAGVSAPMSTSLAGTECCRRPSQLDNLITTMQDVFAPQRDSENRDARE